MSHVFLHAVFIQSFKSGVGLGSGLGSLVGFGPSHWSHERAQLSFIHIGFFSHSPDFAQAAQPSFLSLQSGLGSGPPHCSHERAQLSFTHSGLLVHSPLFAQSAQPLFLSSHSALTVATTKTQHAATFSSSILVNLLYGRCVLRSNTIPTSPC